MSDQRTYIKHFVECNCILQIFKHLPSPPFHQFPVFSELEGAQQKFVSHFAICPNCNAVHKVLEVGHSKIQRRETLPTLKTKEDISANLPDKVASLLEKNECDITVYQEVEFIFQHQLWGKPVVIYKEIQDGETHGKSLTLLGETLVKVDNFSFSNMIDLKEEKEEGDE